MKIYFDGMGCGQLALDKLGIEAGRNFADNPTT